jgi:hypothetical protein
VEKKGEMRMFVIEESKILKRKQSQGISNSLSGGCGVQLGPLGTAAPDWPIAPGDYGVGEFGGMKHSEKTCPSATLPTTNPT